MKNILNMPKIWLSIPGVLLILITVLNLIESSLAWNIGYYKQEDNWYKWDDSWKTWDQSNPNQWTSKK